MNTFEYAHDLFGSRAKTLASLPKRDWCRLALVIDERQVEFFNFRLTFHVLFDLVANLYQLPSELGSTTRCHSLVNSFFASTHKFHLHGSCLFCKVLRFTFIVLISWELLLSVEQISIHLFKVLLLN